MFGNLKLLITWDLCFYIYTIVHRLWLATGDRNVSRDLLSFMAKTMRCNAYDTIPTERVRQEEKAVCRVTFL